MKSITLVCTKTKLTIAGLSSFFCFVPFASRLLECRNELTCRSAHVCAMCDVWVRSTHLINFAHFPVVCIKFQFGQSYRKIRFEFRNDALTDGHWTISSTVAATAAIIHGTFSMKSRQKCDGRLSSANQCICSPCVCVVVV